MNYLRDCHQLYHSLFLTAFARRRTSGTASSLAAGHVRRAPAKTASAPLVLLQPPLPGTSCRRHAPPVPLRAPRRRTPSPCPAVTPLPRCRSSRLMKRTPISPQPPPRARAETQSRAPFSPSLSDAAAHGLHAEPPPLSSLDPSHPRERVPLGSLILPSPLTAAPTLRSAAAAVCRRRRP